MSSRDPDMNISWLKILAVAMIPIVIVGSGFALFAFHTVPDGHVGVEKKWGDINGNTHEPGATWINPISTNVQHVEVRPRTYTMSDTSGEGKKSKEDAIVVQTVNGTTVHVDVTVRYNIRDDQVDKFVETWRTENQAEHRLIRPTVRSELRDEAAGIETTDIYTSEGRQRLTDAARSALQEQFANRTMQLEAVQIRGIDLPKEYDEALDEKEVAKQRVEKEEYRVQQERKKAEQQRVQAEADADVIEIKGEALRENRIVLDQQYIEAIDSGSVFVVPQNGSTPMIMDASDAESSESDSESDYSINASQAGNSTSTDE